MKLKDRLRFVRQNMAKTKSRVFMTVLATAMGCAFLIVLASVGFGLQKSIVDRTVDNQLVTEITVYGKEKGGGYDTAMTDEDLAYLRGVKHVKAVTSKQPVRQELGYTVDGRKETNRAPTVAIDFPNEIKAGMELSAGRTPESPEEIVIGYHFRERFAEENGADGHEASGNEAASEGKKETPPASEWIGRTVHITLHKADGTEKDQALTIVGVKSAPTREWEHDNMAYIGQDLLSRIEDYTGTLLGELPDPGQNVQGGNQADGPKPLTEKRTYWDVRIIADHVKHVTAIAKEIRSSHYANHSIANELDQINMVFAIMNVGLIFVGTIAVLIASIGIYNTMTMAVTERTPDIGIMKAIGAHPKSIRAVFLLESAIIGLLGSIIGAVVSYGISFAVNAAMPLIIKGFMDEKLPEGFMFSRIPLYLTAVSVAISLGVALLSGYRPALRATKVDVLKALRRDV